MAIINISGLWKKTKGVSTYYSGPSISVEELIRKIGDDVEDIRFGLFPVKEKKSDKSPDVSLVIFTDDQPQTRQSRPYEPPKYAYYPPPPKDEIPF